jgi:hypothetical protein
VVAKHILNRPKKLDFAIYLWYNTRVSAQANYSRATCGPKTRGSSKEVPMLVRMNYGGRNPESDVQDDNAVGILRIE